MNSKRKACIFIVSGPSGSGKTSLIKKMLQKKIFDGALVKPLSFTTRQPRRGEKRNSDYHFITRKEFNKCNKNKEFLESQEIFGSFYATSKKEIAVILKQHKDVLLCIDVQGAQAVKKIFPKQTILIFILPPEFRILHQRLMWRGTEDSKDLSLRLERAKEEITHAEVYDYVIVNDKFNQALRALEAVILAERASVL